MWEMVMEDFYSSYNAFVGCNIAQADSASSRDSNSYWNVEKG